MTIIVLLILAGVSLNAIIGDNGIINNAMEAKMKTGMVALEEFLQEEYVGNFDKIDEAENKVVSLINLPNTSSYFYKPTKGSLKYIVDSELHSLYLIDKSGLPKEIREGLVGGDAGKKEYNDYASLNDVYGVTSDLKVYYCSNGLETIIGLTKEQLDMDDPFREVLSADNPLSELITGEEGKTFTAEEIKSVTELNVDGKKLNTLKDLYNLISLKKIRITDYQGSLSGLENVIHLSEIFIENSTISDYSPIGKLGNSLVKLYFYNTKDEEIRKLCDKSTLGIGNYDLPNLDVFGIMGNDLTVNADFTVENNYLKSSGSGKSKNTISSVSCLDNLSDKTKSSIKYLFLNNNKIETFVGLEDFSGVIIARIDYNCAKTLKGLDNMKNLNYLVANDNQLGVNESYDINLPDYGKNGELDALSSISNDKNLLYLNLKSNNLRWIGYLSELSSLSTLYLTENPSLCDVPLIKMRYLSCTDKSIDAKYSLDLIDEINTKELDLKNQTLTYSNLDSIKKCSNLTALRLDGITLNDNGGNQILDKTVFTEKINEFLEPMTQMKNLSLNSLSLLTNINFVENMMNLVEVELLDTNITDLSKLINKTDTLDTLGINNGSIDLTTIQDLIDCCKGVNHSKWGPKTSVRGLYMPSLALLKNLNQCKKITSLNLVFENYPYDPNVDDLIDLTGCISLLSFRMVSVYLPFKLPASTTSVVWGYSMYLPDLTSCSDLTSLRFSLESVGPTVKSGLWGNMIKTLKNCTKLTVLNFQRSRGYENLSWCEDLKDLTQINTLTLGGLDWNLNRQLISLEGIEYLRNLTTLSINYCPNLSSLTPLSGLRFLKSVDVKFCDSITSIPDLKNSLETLNSINFLNCKITDISNLAGLKITQLYLQNNNITNLNAIENLNTLTTLDVSNNVLSNTFSYIDEENKTITKNNLTILANLHKNGSLSSLKISGNVGITDYSPLTSVGYDVSKDEFSS